MFLYKKINSCSFFLSKEFNSKFNNDSDIFKKYLNDIKNDGVQYRCGAIIFNKKRDKILLVKNKKCKKWGLPKGSINKGESKLNCALREVKEETGIDLNKHGIIEKYIKVDKYFYLIVHLDHWVYLNPEDTEEIKSVNFISLEKIPQLYSNSNLKKIYENFLVKYLT